MEYLFFLKFFLFLYLTLNDLVHKPYSNKSIFYLLSLKKTLSKYQFTHVFDLQNSSRTKFYKNILFPKTGLAKWSSSETTLPEKQSKEEFDKKSVLERFEHQLKTSGIIQK